MRPRDARVKTLAARLLVICKGIMNDGLCAASNSLRASPAGRPEGRLQGTGSGVGMTPPGMPRGHHVIVSEQHHPYGTILYKAYAYSPGA